MITIDLVNQTGEGLELKYDQHRGMLFNGDGVTPFPLPPIEGVIDQYPIKQQEPDALISRGEVSGRKSSDLTTLKIQLGLKCNYSCSYCLQATHIDDAASTGLADAKAFMDKIDDWLTASPKKIEFWGGEPLLYLKKIKYMAPLLRKKFPYAKFSMITNGSLLNDDVVDFLDEYDFDLALSHDGPGQWVRGPDPFDDPVVKAAVVRLITEKARTFSINSVLSKETMDFPKSLKWFQDKLELEGIPLNIAEIIAFYDDDTLAHQRFTPAELGQLEDMLFYDLMADDGTGLGPHGQMVEALKMFYNQKESKYLGQKCGMDRPDVLSTDLNGDIATCQNVAPKGEHYVGSVYEIKTAEVKSSTHWANRDMCQECPVVQLCKGSCMFLHGEQFDASCETSFAYNMAALKAALFLITGGHVVTGMRGNIIRPTPKLDKTSPSIIAIG